jgi:dTDP-4-dehydrorhamnose 3,5-epimerase
MRGEKDPQTVTPKGARFPELSIDGVKIIELTNVLTRSGWVTELFRTDWPAIGIQPRHVIFAQMNVGGVTDWHRHTKQTDHLIGIGGNIKLVLWDGREDSPTKNNHDIIRMGAARPVLVSVPPGVWHGLRNESGLPAAYINVNDEPYDHANPDNYRLSAAAGDVPVEL